MKAVCHWVDKSKHTHQKVGDWGTQEETPGGQSKGQQAKGLLARYGSAYLITSISFAAVSFGLCYLLVSSGAAGALPATPRCQTSRVLQLPAAPPSLFASDARFGVV